MTGLKSYSHPTWNRAQNRKGGGEFRDLCSTFPISVALNGCGKTNWKNKVHHHPAQVRNEELVLELSLEIIHVCPYDNFPVIPDQALVL